MATQMFGRLLPKTLTSLTSFRSLSTRATILSLVERLNHSPNSSALKLRNGCDYYRNYVVMQKHWIGPFDDLRSRVEIIHDYVKTLAKLVGRGSKDDGILLHYRVEVLPRVSEIIRDDPFLNIDEMLLLWPPYVMEKSVRQELEIEEEFLKLLLTIKV